MYAQNNFFKTSNKMQKKKQTCNILYCFLRIAVIAGIIILFLPGLNPARITTLINRNLSLFTTGVSYGQLTTGLGKAFRKGWIEESTMHICMISGLLCCLGITIQGIAACATLGKHRLQRIGNKGILSGSLFSLFGIIGIFCSYQKLLTTSKPEKVNPSLPITFYLISFLTLAIIITAAAILILDEKADPAEPLEIEPKYKLFLIALPFIALAILFGYLPLLGWRYAFFDYKAGDILSMDNFVGFKWFAYLVKNEATRNDTFRVMKNTLGMSGLGIATSWVSMAFAVFLNEIKNSKYRRFVQTFTTVPNFISWVLIFAVALSIFSADGFVSNLMTQTGQWESGKNLLMSNNHVWLQMLLWGTWKGVGWGAIIYIAAISGIDQQLYEAAEVDGAGRFQKMWNITIPELLPTYCVLLLLSIGNILSNGLDQYLVFENSVNSSAIQVLDLYVYKLGVAKGLIPLTTAIGMLKSVVSIILVLAANKIAKAVRGENII